MEIENQDVVIVLTHEGRGALRDLGMDFQSIPALLHALEKDDQGIWVLHQREDGDHSVLVRWEHIKALDVARGAVEVKEVGPVN